MIYVRTDETKIPTDWRERARDISIRILECNNDQEKTAIISNNSRLWSQIKPILLEMSHGKCWYSEAKEYVSDWHVDHFRPKSIYPWLSFEWTNYRVSGGIPNRIKDNNFPLADDSQRASLEHPDCSREFPLLIDPTNPDEPGLIMFDERGLPLPLRPASIFESHRVEETTKHFDLDAKRLQEARQDVWMRCEEWIGQLDKIYLEPERIDRERLAEIARIRGILKAMAQPNEPFSSVVRWCLRKNNHEDLIPGPEHRDVSRRPARPE